MLRVESGKLTQLAPFNTSITAQASFTVYRSRNGGTATVMTAPTINELDATNMPGEYSLLLDEDMTITSGLLTEAMVFWITHIGMPPVRLEIELFLDEVNLRSINKFLAIGEGQSGDKWRGGGAA